jgi:hypothetical protein
VIRDFTTLTGQQLPPINRQLTAARLGPIEVISEEAWRKANPR